MIRLTDYREPLHACRFCPMCKPAGEVANVTQLESHTTRARAMMLWRILNGALEWDARAVEILYQSTLDSIAEAWCVSHYAVSGYVAAARTEVYAADLAPAVVKQAVRFTETLPQPQQVQADVLLLAAEIAELGDPTLIETAQRALQPLTVAPVVMSSGALAYSLGALDAAREQAARVAALIAASGARLVIADGSQTLWALCRIFPLLGVALPDHVIVKSLSEYLAESASALPQFPGRKAFAHDSRSAALLADRLARPEAIQPGFRGDEAALGTGSNYDAPRRLIDAMSMERTYSVWSRALSRSSGADDGLLRTYPSLAAGLANQRLQLAKQTGADLLVADSPLDAAHLSRFATEAGIEVRWLPELIARGAP